MLEVADTEVFGLIFIREVGLFSVDIPSCVKGFWLGGSEMEDGAFAAVEGGGWFSVGLGVEVEDGEAAGAGVGRGLPVPLGPPSFARRFARICAHCQRELAD